jgi:hypothetical protein
MLSSLIVSRKQSILLLIRGDYINVSFPVYLINDHKEPVLGSHNSNASMPNCKDVRRSCLKEMHPFHIVLVQLQEYAGEDGTGFLI